jgi:hypothetical protein
MDLPKAYRHISEPRFSRYLYNCQADKHNALYLYECNSRLSEALYTSLNHYEVALRNGANFTLTKKFGPSWFDIWSQDRAFHDFHKDIDRTKKQILRRQETLTANKIVAEFTLGFWTKMYNNKYERLIWKDLRMVYQNISKTDRQRTTIAPFIQKIRKFRNRVYHYEPIIWNFGALEQNYNNISQVLEWIDVDLHNWVSAQCNFIPELRRIEIELNQKGVSTR